jgi:transposase
VVEVDRPNRQRRRRRGKSDPQDAIGAARAAQSGDALGTAKTRDGNVEAMRVLRVSRSSARKARTQALNQMRSLISTAPDNIRNELRHLNVYRLLERAAAYRPGTRRDLTSLTKLTLRMLARRAQTLETEVAELDAILGHLVTETAPQLIARNGIGTDSASALLVAAGDNPDRLRSEATFAHLCGASPLDASSGKNETPPSQPRRRPPSQRRALADRRDPHGVRPSHAPLHRAAHERRPHKERSLPLPQALHRPRGLPMPTPPATRP